MAQLSADHLGIIDAPEVVTHCAPDSVVTELYTSFQVVGASPESQVGVSAGCMQEKSAFCSEASSKIMASFQDFVD